MDSNQRNMMSQCAMISFCNGQFYASFCCVAGLVHMGGKLSHHERHLMCDIFLGIVNRIIVSVQAARMQFATKFQALQQTVEPTEAQKLDLQGEGNKIQTLLGQLSVYVHEMTDIVLQAQSSFDTNDYEPQVFLLRLLGECLGMMCQMVCPDDQVVNTAASTAFAFGVVYGFHLPPTDPTNLENIISYCIFAVRNLRNIDAAIELAIYGKTSCTEDLIRASSNVQATRHRLDVLDRCLEVWIDIRNIRNGLTETNAAPTNAEA